MKCISAMTYMCSRLEKAILQMGGVYVWDNNNAPEISVRKNCYFDFDFDFDCNEHIYEYEECKLLSVCVEPDSRIAGRYNIIMRVMNKKVFNITPDRVSEFEIKQILENLPEPYKLCIDPREYMYRQLADILKERGGSYSWGRHNSPFIIHDECDSYDSYEIVELQLVKDSHSPKDAVTVVCISSNYNMYTEPLDVFDIDDIVEIIKCIK